MHLLNVRYFCLYKVNAFDELVLHAKPFQAQGYIRRAKSFCYRKKLL